MYIDVYAARRTEAFKSSAAFFAAAYKYCFQQKMPALQRRADGKPYLDGPICFNLSHSGAFIVCAFDREEIGVDLQKIRRVPTGVIKNHLHTDSDNPMQQVFEWTKYESYGKMVGSGIPLNKDDEYERGCFVHSFEITGYVLTVCSEKREYQGIHLVWI